MEWHILNGSACESWIRMFEKIENLLSSSNSAALIRATVAAHPRTCKRRKCQWRTSLRLKWKSGESHLIIYIRMKFNPIICLLLAIDTGSILRASESTMEHSGKRSSIYIRSGRMNQIKIVEKNSAQAVEDQQISLRPSTKYNCTNCCQVRIL